MNKKGASLVELIAVIVIMGVIASIATLTISSVINRQRRNATINSLNGIYETAKGLLIQVETGTYDENITLIDDDFCYISLSTMLDEGIIDGSDYRANGDEIYFCYDFNDSFVIITADSVSNNRPDSTGSTIVNSVMVTFDFQSNKFISA